MQPGVKKYLLLLGLVMSGLAALLWLEQKQKKDSNRHLGLAFSEAQQVIIDKELDFVRLMQGNLADTATLQRNWSEHIETARDFNISINVFYHDTLKLWTDNLVNASQLLGTVKDGTAYRQLSNGHYLTYKQKRGNYTYVFFYLVKSEYNFRNQYIRNQFSKELQFIKEGLIYGKPVEHFTDIKNLSGKYLFSLQVFAYSSSTPTWMMISVTALAVAFLVLLHLLARHYIKRHLWITSIIFFGLLAAVRGLNIFYHAPDFIYSLKLFNPSVYASSVWFPSLGDLFIDSAIILWYFILLENRSRLMKKQRPGRVRNILLITLHGALSFAVTNTVVYSIRSITIDSQISFDINNFFSINFFTYLGLVITIIQLLIVYFVCRNFTRVARLWQGAGNKTAYLVLAACSLAYILFCDWSTGEKAFIPTAVLALTYTFIVFKSLRLKLNRFQQYFFVIIIISLSSSVFINHWLNLKERENRKLFAVKLISQNDITTDYYLRTVEKKILNDEYIEDYFQNFLIVKSNFEKRIRQLYFTGYLSRFDVNVYDYDTAGSHFKQRNPYTYNQVNKLYREKTSESINRHFKYANSSTEAKGYLSKFEIRHRGRLLGYLFISLQPKLIQDENRFDDLLIEGYRNKRRDQNYSYAVYKDKNLIFQSGDYPYRITNTWGETNNDFRFFEEDGFGHMLYTDRQPLTIAVSKPADAFPQIIGLFSFIFTFCTVTLIIILFAYIGLNAQVFRRFSFFRNRFTRKLQRTFNNLLMIDKPDILYIRTRIQTSIIFILFVTLAFSGYFTISFITQKYNNRQNERLMKKLRNVVLTIENEKLKDMSWSTPGEVEAFVNQIADFYDTDVNLFDRNGRLMASSISKIYDEGVIANLMQPSAYYHLSLLKESQFAQQENIVLLDFEAAYAPVFRNKKEVLGYLQLPYFSQQTDLLAEISSIVVGFINLYVVLFILIGVLAYLVSRNISYPLTLIQQKLSKTVLGGKNEPISWHRDDEIGELVRQYNFMILELERSAMKLAETEREGAWREIARQIAHEIKNPLTPMKLSIQHLQRAYKNNDVNLEEKLNRTAKLLVQQIDTLSELATEFSSFAKMPAPVYEQINVCSALQQIIDLYSVNADAEISLECHVTSELHYDSSYFSRSIGNLVKNAIQAIPEGQQGKISVKAEEYNETIRISVKDNGSGISEEQAEKIFMPYFSTKISGMGLGLPIVKNMIESGRGTITFHSVPGEGTTFTVELPKQ